MRSRGGGRWRTGRSRFVEIPLNGAERGRGGDLRRPSRRPGGREVVSSNLTAPTERQDVRWCRTVSRRGSRPTAVQAGGLAGRSRHGARQEPQQDHTGGNEHQAHEVVQVHAVTRAQRHREEDRVEAVRVEPDDGGPERDRDDSEHPPQGTLRVPALATGLPLVGATRRFPTGEDEVSCRRAGVWRPPFPLPWGGRWVAGSALPSDAKTSRRLRSENVKSAGAGSKRASQEVVPAALGATPRTAAGRNRRLRAGAPGGSAPCRPRATSPRTPPRRRTPALCVRGRRRPRLPGRSPAAVLRRATTNATTTSGTTTTAKMSHGITWRSVQPTRLC